MSFCKECGFKLSEEAKFCPNYGTPAVIKEVSQESDIVLDKTIKHTKPPQYGTIRLEDLPVGYVIDERYKIKEKLGQGGFGAVYRAFDRYMEIDKALKIIPEAIVNDREAMRNLHEEAKIMIKLNHPNIVRVYDFHHRGNIKYIDMEYIDGPDLTDLKLESRENKLPEEDVRKYALQIAEGLKYAHHQNVIHKDIKPQNIILTSKNEVKIMDFGIAETVRTSMSRLESTLTSGTLVYMSPEQIRGKDVGKESDIYSFGVTLYELLAGHPPFYKGDINYQILNEKPGLISKISTDINELLQKCLAKDYKERFSNFEDIIVYLDTMKNRKEEKLLDSKKEKKLYHREKLNTYYFGKIKEIFAEILCVEKSNVTMESSFVNDFGADSLDIVQLLMKIEEEFNIEIPDKVAVAEKLITVGDTVNYISSFYDIDDNREAKRKINFRSQEKNLIATKMRKESVLSKPELLELEKDLKHTIKADKGVKGFFNKEIFEKTPFFWWLIAVSFFIIGIVSGGCE